MAFTKALASPVIFEPSKGPDNNTAYGEILADLCSKIEGASYYSGSSSTLFLRGTLGKYEEKSNAPSARNSFSPRGLTDALLEKLLVQDSDRSVREGLDTDGKDQSDSEYENYLKVVKALAGDPFKYLPAITESLSDLVLSASSANLSSPQIGKTISIPQEFLRLWIATITDASTPLHLQQSLSNSLFDVFQKQQRLRKSDNPSLTPTHTLRCLVEEDVWHGNQATKPIAPPETKSTLRRVSFLVRFLTRDSGCDALDAETKVGIARAAGAFEWLRKVLEAKGYPTRYHKQCRETRSGLLDLLTDECKGANDTASGASLEWLFSPELVDSVLGFFTDAIRELLEDWNGHLTTPQQAMKPPPGTIPQTNHDLVTSSHREALSCATRFVKFLARLPPPCPLPSLVITQKASSDSNHDGKYLLATMLRQKDIPLQRLRLVRLLIDEFGNTCSVENAAKGDANAGMARKDWLSSPNIMAPVLEECSKDPFLGSSASTLRYFEIYGDPSWKESLPRKPMPRQAPAAMPIQPFPPTRVAETNATQAMPMGSKPWAPIARWFTTAAETFPRRNFSSPEAREKFLLLLRSRVGETPNDDRYSLFHEKISADKTPQQRDQYNLFDGERNERGNAFNL